MINCLPFRSRCTCYAIPLVLWYSQVFQVPANGIPPSSLRPSLWARHPNSVIFGIRWFGILARCPSHSNLRLHTLSVAVSRSPHRCLISCEVMCSSHCCLLVMPSTVRMHLWWKESSFLSSLCGGFSSLIHTVVWTTRMLGRCFVWSVHTKYCP